MSGTPGAMPMRWRPGQRQAAAASWLLALAVLGYLSYRGATGPARDLEVYRAGAFAVRRGHGLYTIVTSTGLPFTYPPVAGVLAVVLTIMPFALAKVAWVVVMVCVPLGITVWFGFRPMIARAGQTAGGRQAGGAAAQAAVFAIALSCCALLFPVRQEFYFGQVDLLLVALCLLDCLVSEPKWPRGVLIGLATAIKLEPGVFVVYLLITRRWRAAAAATLSFAAFTGLAFLVDPRDSATYWTSAIFQTRRIGGAGSAANQSLRGMIIRAFKPHLAPQPVWLAIALIVAIAGFAAARSCWRRGDERAGVAITGLLAAILSPVGWIHHYCWVVFAIGVIASDARSRNRVAVAVATVVLFATMLPIQAQSMINGSRLGVFPGRELEDAFGLAGVLLIVIIWQTRARGRGSDRERSTSGQAVARSKRSSGADAAKQVPSGTG